EMNVAHRLGIRGIVVHTGSFFDLKSHTTPVFNKEKYSLLLQNIWFVLSHTPDDVLLILENAGVRKIGSTIDELGFIIKNLHSDRVTVCLDTCHLHAAGYELSTTEGF